MFLSVFTYINIKSESTFSLSHLKKSVKYNNKKKTKYY